MMSQHHDGCSKYHIPVLSCKSSDVRYKDKTAKNSAVKNGDLQTNPAKTVSTNPGCFMQYPFENSTKLYFNVPNEKHYKSTGVVKYSTLECVNITAADFKVSSKYGSWDAMSCRLLVECQESLLVLTPLIDEPESVNTTDVNKLSTQPKDVVSTDSETVKKPVSDVCSFNPNITYIGKRQESCMIKATFDIAYVSVIRDMLRTLKLAQSKERKLLLKKHKNGEDKHIKVPPKIREGLPEWVNYVPAQWYSSSIRKTLEYILIIYTILTLSWAAWQLYKHVGFIRTYLKPLIQFIEFYFAVIKYWFYWLDSFFETLTEYWWTFLKPLYVLITPLYITLSQLFKPLRNVAGLITLMFKPILEVCSKLGFVFKPIASFLSELSRPIMMLFGYVTYSVHALWDAVLMLWSLLSNTSTIKGLVGYASQFGVTRIVNELLHGSLDPLKAQMLVIRDILIRSFKQIFYGVKFIVTRIQATIMFVKQEREYSKEQNEDEVSNERKIESHIELASKPKLE